MYKRQALVRQAALDDNDRYIAAAAWGGVLLSGPFPIAPALIWFTSRKRRDSLAFRCARQATLFWLVVTVVYVPALLVESFIPALTAGPGEEVPSPPGWFWLIIGVVLPAALIVSGVGVVRAIRSPVRPPPPLTASERHAG